MTVQHGTPNQKQDAMNIWIANVSTSQFEVCLQESRTFDGTHDKLIVVCYAYEILQVKAITSLAFIKVLLFIVLFLLYIFKFIPLLLD